MTTTTPVTILQLAEHRGLKKDAEGNSSAADFADVGLGLLGGCAGCHASIAAYNAYPSKAGYWLCKDCVGNHGFTDVESANQAVFAATAGYTPKTDVELKIEFVACLQRFEFHGNELLKAWEALEFAGVEVPNPKYPFPESFDDVLAKLRTFQQDVTQKFGGEA